MILILSLAEMSSKRNPYLIEHIIDIWIWSDQNYDIKSFPLSLVGVNFF